MTDSYRERALRGCRAVGRAWSRYWSQDIGPWSVEIARIGIAVAVLMTLLRTQYIDFHDFLAAQGQLSYAPVGVLKLLGSQPPSAAFMEGCRVVAYASTLLALLGLFSRFSMWTSLVSSLMILSLSYSFQERYPHGFNVVFLAQLAFVAGTYGRCLSLDGLGRRFFSRKFAGQTDRLPAWPVLLAQLAVALMLFNAAFLKWQADELGAWVWSDNMRHQLIRRYYVFDEAVPAIVEWLVESQWRYKLCALGNMVCQALPILACFCMRRPYWRLGLGVLFVLEVLGLGFVMELWNLHWLPLAVLFVDWDFFGAKVRGFLPGRDLAGAGETGAGPTSPLRQRPALWVNVFVACFLGYYVYVAFNKGVQYTHRNFPFGRFALYNNVAAKKPYHRHQSYEVFRPTFEVKSDRPLSAWTHSLLHRRFHHLIQINRADSMRAQMGAVVAWLEDRGPREVTLKKTIIQTPPYPGPPRPQPIHEGTMARWSSDGHFEAVTGAPLWDGGKESWYLDVQTIGFEEPRFRFGYVLDYTDGPKPLEGELVGSHYYYTPRERGRYQFVVYVSEGDAPETTYFVGRKGHRRPRP